MQYLCSVAFVATWKKTTNIKHLGMPLEPGTVTNDRPNQKSAVADDGSKKDLGS